MDKKLHNVGGYEAHKERARKRSRAESEGDREVTPLPKVKNPERRQTAFASLRFFCETYGQRVFYSSWSPAHLTAINKLEIAIETGGKFALAWPRGRGKTALFVFSCLWAILTGRRRYVFVLAANEGKAKKIIAAMLKLLSKDAGALIRADFPEATHVFWRLEGIHQRKLLWNGAPITYSLEATRIVLPVIPDSVCAGAIIEAAGLDSATRGTFEMSDDGEHLRPDLLLIDDPQTKESARSPTQVVTRWELLKESVMGMSGTGKALAAIAAVTVIADDDLAEKLLDHKLSPEWRGERFPLMPMMPESDLWDEYARLRSESLVSTGDIQLATDFYCQNRQAMDAGAEIMWSADFKAEAGEVSAVQAAMNLYFEDAATFWAEFQQQPGKGHKTDEVDLAADLLKRRWSGLPRGTVAATSNLVTSFIDVQESLFFYVVVAWREGFGGDVIDYGTFPEQKRTYFTKADAQRRLQHLTLDGVKLKGLSVEERWLKGLGELTRLLLTKDWKRENGGTEKIQRCLIDAQYGKSTQTIYSFIKTSPFRSLLLPSHGEPIGPTSSRISERKLQDNQRRGDEWIEDLHPQYHQRRVRYDANHWKVFTRNRLANDVAARGALRFFTPDAVDGSQRHEMIANHILSEKPIKVTARGRESTIFAKPSGDNDLLDALSGNCICASMLGLKLEQQAPKKPKRKRRRMSVLNI